MMRKRLYERGIRMSEPADQIVYRNDNAVVVSECMDHFIYNSSQELIILANQVCHKFQIEIKDLILIEHYYNDDSESYFKLNFSIIDGRFCNPVYNIVFKDYVDDMMLAGYILK